MLIVELFCFSMFRTRVHFSVGLSFSSATSKIPSFGLVTSVKFRLKLFSETAGPFWSVTSCFWAIFCLKSKQALSIVETRSRRSASSFSFSIFHLVVVLDRGWLIQKIQLFDVFWPLIFS